MLGHNEFVCSTGWLQRFRGRHSVTFRAINGEAHSVDKAQTDDWYSFAYIPGDCYQGGVGVGGYILEKKSIYHAELKSF